MFFAAFFYVHRYLHEKFYLAFFAAQKIKMVGNALFYVFLCSLFISWCIFIRNP